MYENLGGLAAFASNKDTRLNASLLQEIAPRDTGGWPNWNVSSNRSALRRWTWSTVSSGRSELHAVVQMDRLYYRDPPMKLQVGISRALESSTGPKVRDAGETSSLTCICLRSLPRSQPGRCQHSYRWAPIDSTKEFPRTEPDAFCR